MKRGLECNYTGEDIKDTKLVHQNIRNNNLNGKHSRVSLSQDAQKMTALRRNFDAIACATTNHVEVGKKVAL